VGHAQPPTDDAQAESKKRAKRGRAAKRPRRAAKPRSDKARAKPRSDKARKPAANARPRAPQRSKAAQAAAQAAQQAEGEVIREGDTSVKVMTFSGLDIEGRLKSPQLLYFVNRVHTEFARPRLPHRSFLPEIARSTQQSPVR
jgi:hypothetical protein